MLDAYRVLLDQIAVTRMIALDDPTGINIRAYGWAVMNLRNTIPIPDDGWPLRRAWIAVAV